ncbi:MAG: hypothetical protein M1814_006667 [Vezdaea aestivalis]|nr:MAG: hypothetical protein M1814_006667 [Vezdaea aestivalis]
MDQLTEIPLFVMRDTPLRSLYRLYEDFCTNLTIMGFESQYFFLHPEKRWQVFEIPDPCDFDITRYTILASLAEALADACNRRLQFGLHRDGKIDRNKVAKLEKAPLWASRVGPLPERLFLSDSHSSKSGATIAVERRNISVAIGEIYRTP